jgi:outer membrane protein assembly factor BamA
VIRFAFATTVFALLLVSYQGGDAQTQTQSSDRRQILVESFVISGTQSVDSTELAEITNSIAGSRFNDDAEELQERIRAEFQNRGYFKAEIKKLDIKTIDPLASPKPVRLEAQVSEGPRCRLGVVEFTGNHAFSSDALRAKFPIKIGSEFSRAKIGGGLVSMRRLYGSQGFLDSVFVPDVNMDSSATVKLSIEVQEGPQYRMDKFEVFGPLGVAENLQTRWKLAPGAVFDAGYLPGFLDKNHSLLPADFNQSNGVALLTDCPDATVAVHLHLTSDAQHDARDRTLHVDCSKPADDKAK